jgi:hypothetical protein
MADSTQIFYTVKVNTENGKVQIDGLTKGFVNAKTAVNNLGAALDNNNKKLNNNINKTGLASATLVELGRTISDSNYGMTAMANNLSQLSTLAITLVGTTNGLAGAMTALWRALMGPVGIILVFQTLIKYMEKSAMEAKKAQSVIGGMAKSVAGAATDLKILVKALNDSTTSLEDKKKILNDIKNEYDDLNPQLDEENKLTKESKLAIDNKIVALERLAKAQFIMKEIGKLNEKIAEAEIKSINEFVGWTDQLRAYAVNLGNEVTASIDLMATGADNKTKEIKGFKDEIQKLFDVLEKENLFPELLGDEDGTDAKRYKQNLFNLSRIRNNFDKQSEQSAIEFEEQKINRDKKYAEEDITLRYETFLAKERIRYQEKLAVAENEEQKALIEKTYEATKTQARQEYLDTLFSLEDAFETKLFNLRDQQFRNSLKLMEEGKAQAIKAQVDLSRNEIDSLMFKRQLEDELHFQKMSNIDEEIRRRAAAGESTAEIEEKRKNEVARHDNESLKIRQKTEMAKLAIANQVGKAIVDIAGEGSAIGKAVSVAMAVMNTREAITAALGAKPYGPWNIAQAAAVGAAGFLQVKEIMAQKLPVEKGSAVSATQIQTPDFNIVGQSQTNLLAEAVGSQLSQPIKAYMVSKDVTTAQEMERNTIGDASLG